MIAQETRQPGTALTAPSSPPETELEHPLLVLRVHSETERRTFFGYATSLGPETLRINATLPRDPGQVYDLEIPLPPSIGGEARCRCEVAWKRDWSRESTPGMGLRFIDLPEEIAVRLAEWIESQSRRPVYRADAVC